MLHSAVQFRQTYREKAQGHNIRRTGIGTEKYRPGNMDGLYIPQPFVIARSGHVCIVAEYLQFVAVVEEKEKRRNSRPYSISFLYLNRFGSTLPSLFLRFSSYSE